MVDVTGKTILVKNEFLPWYGGLTFTFADGVSWSRSQVSDAASTFNWIGSSSNGTMNGNAYGANVFQFGDGPEVPNGGSRSNIYQASTTTRQATINMPVNTGSKNELDFIGDINDDPLWFAQSGNDLTIDLLRTTTKVMVTDWFAAGSGSQLQGITASGLRLDG